MGDRGYNAGGFAYMQVVVCPICGGKRKLGRWSIEQGLTACPNFKACERRKSAGTYLSRIGGARSG